MSPDPRPAQQHVRLLTGSADTPINVRMIYGQGGHAYSLSGPVADLWPQIEAGQAKGYNAYLVVNEGGDDDASITRVRAVFIDADGLPMPKAWHAEPDFIVTRDATHWHAYWVVTNLQVDGFKTAQRRLVAHYGTDPKICNPARLMRLAGSLHLKDPSHPFKTGLTDNTGGEGRSRLSAVVLAGLPEVAAPAQPVASTFDGELDQPHNIVRAVTYLTTIPPAVEYAGGGDQTYVAACGVRDRGISKDTCLELMLQHYNPRCIPEWDDWEIGAIVDHAYLYAQNGAGCEALEAPTSETFKRDAEALGLVREPAGPVPFRDVLKRTVAPVAELIPGLIERGVVTFLAGPGGVHKSRLALQWGLCLDAGAPIFGRPVERATFAYLSCEDHADEVARRAQAITARLQLPDDGPGQFYDLTGEDATLAVVHDSGECEPTEGFERLLGWLQSIPGHKFVVADSTYNVLRFEGSAKINEGGVKAAIALLQRLCDEADATLLVLWHPSQAGQDRGDASGWSVAWHNAPRARLSITAADKEGNAYTLATEKRNHGPKGKPITLHWSAGALLPLTEVPNSESREALIAAVVNVAVMSAEAGAPIKQGSRHLFKWQMDAIEAALGRRPSEPEVKEALASALPRGLLRYQSPTRHKAAGYYPADERAHELALKAKQHLGETADA